MSGPKIVVVNLRVRNSGDADVEFVLEPWGEVYRMPAGATFDVSGEGPSSGDKIEVEYTPTRITLWRWTGATLQVSYDGEALTPESTLAIVPEHT